MINIDKKTYQLDKKYYYDNISDKTQILITDTHTKGMDHIEKWKNKSPIGFKRTTPYTITTDGVIYEHYDSNFTSRIFGLEQIDMRIVPISLENEGCLTFNSKKKKFITWSGDNYSRSKDDVFIEKWRGGLFWAPYTSEQIESLVYLINELCDKHNIPMEVNNQGLNSDYNGVVLKHDYNVLSHEINPSFNKLEFKEKIEEYEETY